MYKDIESLIENTTMKAYVNEKGETVSYAILPIAGYVLHEKNRDENVVDENGEETGEVIKGYTSGLVTALVNYDFDKNEREIYAVPEEELGM